MCKLKNLLLLILFLPACNRLPVNVKLALQAAGSNRSELEKVIQHYQRSGDPLKLKAAYYLISNLPYQYHFEGKTIDACSRLFSETAAVIASGKEFDRSHTGDSLKAKMDSIDLSAIQKVRDIEDITASYLIQNIDDAFKAWQFPWAQKLSFKQFCEYILPYKVKNEKPDNWRSFFLDKYRWVLSAVKNKQDYKEACTYINNDLRTWFYFGKIDFPYDPSFSDLLHLKAGRCPEEVQFTTYAMRAMGIPVAYDYVHTWANRNNGHDWNGLLYTGKVIPFLGTEVEPGSYKIESSLSASMQSRRPKIYRKIYAAANRFFLDTTAEQIPDVFTNQLYRDVTKEYMPVTNVLIRLQDEAMDHRYAYLCVFNNLTWKPVHWSRIRNGQALFTDMGRNIVYMPMIYEDKALMACGAPFILQKDGNIACIRADKSHKSSITIDRKYPSGDDNKIETGQRYELMYWDNNWKSLDKQLADTNYLTFTNIPAGALLWLRNLDTGMQERIFTINNNTITWW